MIDLTLRSEPRCPGSAFLAITIGLLWIVASLACAAQTATAQAVSDRPFYADGEIHCPDGTTSIFHSAGEEPTEAALRLACEFKGAGEQAAENKAAFDKMEAMKSAPVSPNGRAMEATWERAPVAPDENFEDPKPYFVSSWGGIVIRGKRNGGRIDRALAARHCGASDNPTTDIYFIGEEPPNICEGVVAVAANETQSFESPITLKGRETKYIKFGTSDGWVVREFLQNINDITVSGRAPAIGEAALYWGISSLGAFYRNEDGKHVFYAPGETVKLFDDFSFVVEPVMDFDELQAKVAEAGLRGIADDPKFANLGAPEPKTPWQWAFLLVFGVPLAAIGGVIYGILRFIRRRRGALPAAPGATISPADIPVGMSHTNAADAVSVSEAAPAPVGEVKAVDQAEEFFGPSRTSANFRRKGWFTLLIVTGPGLFFFSMLWWGEPTVVTNFMEVLFHFVVAKLLPLGLIAIGITGAVLNFRLGSKPEVETLWYRLDRAGLHILHDAVWRVAQRELAQQPGETGALIAWAAIKSVVAVPGASPKVKIVRRAPGAGIDRTVTLFAGQKSRDGALFEDRLSRWFAEQAAGATAAPTMTGALPPQRDDLREIKGE